MKVSLALSAAAALVAGLALSAHAEDKKVTSPLDFTVKAIDGKSLDLSQYKGKVVLFVNVASRCGYTRQYEGLQKLHDKYAKDGLVVVGVPANEFGSQEPGTDEQIAEFCKTNYAVSFPMLSKVVVKGDGISPLYAFLTGKDTNPEHAGAIGWNFEKFLVGRDGKVIKRFKSGAEPESEQVTGAIEAALAAK